MLDKDHTTLILTSPNQLPVHAIIIEFTIIEMHGSRKSKHSMVSQDLKLTMLKLSLDIISRYYKQKQGIKNSATCDTYAPSFCHI